ncbi:hypothetical protein [Bifidobacterium adolescentis]|uniref:Uncharacterized protein n=2 Tax=Bifidobacterium adolescentis TaxID=1680 RepID=A0AAF0VB25_BIFAD|nr:hypothetical protein [Bifidobacterium adolescentis]WNE84630.1 hypothetical protein B0703_06350 [Bifidobacterium adolescentis]
MNLEDLIVSTISDAKPMIILALCVIVLFVIVASLVEVRCRYSGHRSGNVPVPNREEQDQGGIDLDEWSKAHTPESVPDRRPWFFKTVMGRGLEETSGKRSRKEIMAEDIDKVERARLARKAIIDHMDCDDCTEDYVFLLRQGGREFGMGLTTVLSMLAFAEHEGAVPPLSTEWWIKVSRRYQ